MGLGLYEKKTSSVTEWGKYYTVKSIGEIAIEFPLLIYYDLFYNHPRRMQGYGEKELLNKVKPFGGTGSVTGS